MKTSILLVAFIVICSCNKKNDNLPESIYIKTFGVTATAYEVDTDQGNVRLFFKDVPEYIAAEAETTSGITPFTTQLRFNTYNARPGRHMIELASYENGNSSKIVHNYILLHVQPLSINESKYQLYEWTNHNDHLVYVRDEKGNGLGFGGTAEFIIDKDSVLSIQDLPVNYTGSQSYRKIQRAAKTIPIEVNCESGEIIIPETTVSSTSGEVYTISGNGTINYAKDDDVYADEYNITYTSSSAATGKQTMKLWGPL